MLRTVVVFLAVISVTFASLALMVPDPKPEKYKDHKGCYVKSIDTVIPPGETVPDKTKCISYRCGDKYVTIVSCGAALAIPPCRLVEHDASSHPHPTCCPTIEC